MVESTGAFLAADKVIASHSLIYPSHHDIYLYIYISIIKTKPFDLTPLQVQPHFKAGAKKIIFSAPAKVRISPLPIITGESSLMLLLCYV